MSVATTLTLKVGSTNTIRLTGLVDTDTGLPVNNATVVLTALLDSTGATVAGTANIAMPFAAASTLFPDGYKGAIPSTVTLVAGAAYTAKITATDTLGNVRLFAEPCVAEAN